MKKVTEIFKMDANGRGRMGLIVVGPEGTDITIPQEGSVTYLGELEGHVVFQFIPGKTGEWVAVKHDILPLHGIKVEYMETIFPGLELGLIIGSEEFVFEQYKHSNRDCNGWRTSSYEIVCCCRGQEETLSPVVWKLLKKERRKKDESSIS